MPAETLGERLTVKFKVIVLSHPSDFTIVFGYAPDVVIKFPPQLVLLQTVESIVTLTF